MSYHSEAIKPTGSLRIEGAQAQLADLGALCHAAPKPVAEIDRELGQLAVELEQIHVAIDRLSGTLQPVLLTKSPANACGETASPQCESPIGQTIQSAAQSARSASRRLRVLLNLLAI